jgi:putative peptidoglycan lipid II flippase
MLGSAFSRVLGIVREQVIAGLFGASAAVDAFTVATRIPTIVFDLLIGGMISAALVPVFSDYAASREEEDELWRVASTVLNLAALGLTLLVALLIVAAPGLAEFFGGGAASGTRELTEAMLRVTMPAVLLMGLSGVLTAILYSRQRFTLPATALSMYNLGIILAAVLLHRLLGVQALVVGVLVGTLLQVLVQAFGLRRMRYRLLLEWRHPAIRRIAKLYLPVAAGLLVSAAGTAIDTNLATRTGEGNLSAMRFATTLMQFPLGLIGAAVSAAVLPRLAQTFARRQGETASTKVLEAEFRHTLVQGLKLVLLTILPATVGLVVLREPIIRVLFERGAFLAADTQRTALAFLFYAPGIPAAALDQVLIFAFYARKDTRTPVLVGVAAVGVYIVTALALVGPWGMPGLAFAIAMQWTAHLAIMTVLAARRLGGGFLVDVADTAARAAVAALAMAVAVYLLWPEVARALPSDSLVALLAGLVAASLAGGVLYVAGLFALRVPEAGRARALLLARARRLR